MILFKPNDAYHYRRRASLYNKKRDYDRALADYTAAIRLESDEASAYYSRGQLYEKIGENRKARADYQKVIALDNNSTYRLLADIALRLLSSTS